MKGEEERKKRFDCDKSSPDLIESVSRIFAIIKRELGIWLIRKLVLKLGEILFHGGNILIWEFVGSKYRRRITIRCK